MLRRATEKDLRGGNTAVDSRPSRAQEVRKVEATLGSTGLDISQKYDAFGNNAFSSADNPWAAFFGAPTAPWKTTSYDKYDRHNYSLPEAYVGQNKYVTPLFAVGKKLTKPFCRQLAQTIDELIYTEETFYTTELLPFNFTDQLTIVWDKWVSKKKDEGLWG